MNSADLSSPGSKPLPPPFRDDKLPPVPPPDHDNATTSPLPPPKIVHDHQANSSHNAFRGPPINTSGALSPNDFGLSVQPITPISPVGVIAPAPPSPSAEPKPKKTNPLTDLVETEKIYVELLTGIIRKVAAAWSRSNLPPPELDTMFRSVEAVYRANRTLLAKLKEIGTNPSSPKALGDLLMRWIDDLETPYTTYVSNFCAGFDRWDPVQSNAKLKTTLAIFSSSIPPPLPPSADPHPAEPPLWTLDDLFILPRDRLKYYKKLYGRLLKSTQPGRSDHRLLTGALDKLDSLLATLEQRGGLEIGVNYGPIAPPAPPPQDDEDEVVVDMRVRDSNGNALKNNFTPDPTPNRGSDSTNAGSFTSGGRLSQETAPTSASEGRSPVSSMRATINDLERRLSTERTLDIFTMTPKQVRLQISPPTLPYTRELRISADAVFNLIPRSTGIQVTQERGHIFILTDLLLICERMSREEFSRFGPDGPDMWLLYPPLAGKHLRVAPVDGSDTELAVTILRKETLILRADSPQLRDRLVYEFRECIDAGANMLPAPRNGQPPPPVPSLPGSNGMPRSPSTPLEFNSRSPMHDDGPNIPQRTSSMSPPSRTLSPGALQNGRVTSPPLGPGIMDGMSRMGLGQDPRMSPNPPPPGPGFPTRSSSTGGGLGPGSSFNPGQIVPGPGFGPGQVMAPPSFGPGQIMNMQPPPGPSNILPPPRGTSNAYRGPGGPPMGLPSRPAPSPMQHPMQHMPGTRTSNMSDASGSNGPTGSRPPSDGSYASVRKSPSSRSLASQFEQMQANGMPPPMPGYPEDLQPPRLNFLPRTGSSGSLSSLQAPQPRPLLPSAQMNMRAVSTAVSFVEPSPPNSPVEETPRHMGPVTSTISAQMKCKVFLKQQHATWKNLGAAKLKLYRESPTNIKQLVVEADNSKKTALISTIVLEDGVERVGKTGVAIELSDQGQRTGIVYMIQLRNESSAAGLFDSLLAGSDRSEAGRS